ncbi:hypothetical protein D0865_15242 [Lecanosticta acicola]|uniref:Uncharacterized protein n=1 Tax=Lecanosticta acicola TaxID=111012 RepID=A0AAI8Z6K8_9PEZI|nr:hypothetical protein D0865_15242 [Lecanosticta acicola]
MFYDLNIPYSATDTNLPTTLAFLHELGYSVAALNHTIAGKLPTDLTSPIPDPLPFKNVPPKLTVLRRVTLVLTEAHQNARLAALAKEYDILAVRPTDERTLQLACGSIDCDIISLDLTQRLPFFFKYKTLSEAIKSGKKLELCYSQGLLGDGQSRRNLISNATQLIRASRGRGLLISSETKAGAVGLRGPWDAINLAAVWGLGQERGNEAMSKEARNVVVSAQLKRTSYKGVINVVYGGEKPQQAEKDASLQNIKGKQKQGQKRKADAVEHSSGNANATGVDPPISKREAKRRAHKARMQTATSGDSNIGDDTAQHVQGVT